MLQIAITNNIRIRGANVPLRSAVTDALTAKNPAFEEKKKRKLPTWGMDQYLRLYSYDHDGSLVVPRGFQKKLEAILTAQGITPSKVIFNGVNEPPAVNFGPWNSEYLPRDYQLPAINAAVKEGGVLVSPAGSGKTLMGMHIVMDWGIPALWLTHTTDLLYQSAKNAELYLQGVGQVGIIGDGKLQWGSGKLFFATVQTLNANPTLVATLDSLIGTLIIDEAHHFPAPYFIEVAGKFRAKNLLGLTATPNRKDFLEMYMFNGIGPICYEVKRETLHEVGNLVLPEVKFVYTSFTTEIGTVTDDNVDAGGEDFDYTGLIRELISDIPRAKLIAEHILDGCIEVATVGGASIVITESVRYCYVLRDLVIQFAKTRLGGNIPRMAVVHGGIDRYVWRKARSLYDAQRLISSGYAVEYRNHQKFGHQIKVEQYTEGEITDWQVTPTQRKEIMGRAYNRQIDILFATQLAREGLDIPHLYRGHLAMPKRGDARTSANGSAVEQEIGRIQRPDPKNPNKKAVWYDYVDNEVGVFYQQYLTRRKVYSRLGMAVPRKKATQRDRIQEFILNDTMFGAMPL